MKCFVLISDGHFESTVFLAALGMKQPPKDWMADYIARNKKTEGLSSGEMLKTPYGY